MYELGKISIQAGYLQLQNELATGTLEPLLRMNSNLVNLPINDLDVMVSVFQARAVGDDLASERHVAILMDAIMNEANQVLDPITCWWSGQRWLVLDGHHRLEAHQKLRAVDKGPTKIPVRVFRGTLDEAHDESIRLNSKDSLNMSRDDKATKAWHMVMLGKVKTIRQVAGLCKVSKSTVGRMIIKREELIADFGAHWLEEVDGLTWKDVINIGVQRDYDEEWEDRQVLAWVRGLQKTFGNKPQKQPELFAKAIEQYSPHLYSALAEWLSHDFSDEFNGCELNDDF